MKSPTPTLPRREGDFSPCGGINGG